MLFEAAFNMLSCSLSSVNDFMLLSAVQEALSLQGKLL